MTFMSVFKNCLTFLFKWLYEKIKKSDQEDNYRPLGEIYNEHFEFPKFCYLCEGYNGPCFDDSTCTKCHDGLLLSDYPRYTTPQLELDGLDENTEIIVSRNSDDDGESHQECSPYAESIPESPSESEDVSSHSSTPTPVSVENFLFEPLLTVENLSEINKNLLKTTFCKKCLRNIINKKEIRHKYEKFREKRLVQELNYIHTDIAEGIRIVPIDDFCYQWYAAITGPSGSPYDGGSFYLYIRIPYFYPFSPPKVQFLTKIFHPNVSRHGNLMDDVLHKNWTPTLTLSKLLLTIQSLLGEPYCEAPMDLEIADLYEIDKASYEVVARAWTRKYAIHRVHKNVLETDWEFL